MIYLFCLPANKEYYHQWSVEDCQGCSLDLSAFTIEELDNITSEYTLKNTVGFHAKFHAVRVVVMSASVETHCRVKCESPFFRRYSFAGIK